MPRNVLRSQHEERRPAERRLPSRRRVAWVDRVPRRRRQYCVQLGKRQLYAHDDGGTAVVGRRPGGRLPYPGDTDHQPRRLLRLVANLHSAVYRAVHRQGNSISIQLAFCSARASQKKHCYLVKCRFLFCEHTHTVKCTVLCQPFCCIASCPHCSAAHNYYSSKLLSNYPIAIVSTT